MDARKFDAWIVRVHLEMDIDGSFRMVDVETGEIREDRTIRDSKNRFSIPYCHWAEHLTLSTLTGRRISKVSHSILGQSWDKEADNRYDRQKARNDLGSLRNRKHHISMRLLIHIENRFGWHLSFVLHSKVLYYRVSSLTKKYAAWIHGHK